MKEEFQIATALEDAVDALDTANESLAKAGREAANKKADYELAKNTTIITLKDEENKNPKLKRTDAIRQAVYREQHHQKRLEWQLAENAFDVEKQIHKGLTSKISALQTLLRRYGDSQ